MRFAYWTKPILQLQILFEGERCLWESTEPGYEERSKRKLMQEPVGYKTVATMMSMGPGYWSMASIRASSCAVDALAIEQLPERPPRKMRRECLPSTSIQDPCSSS